MNISHFKLPIINCRVIEMQLQYLLISIKIVELLIDGFSAPVILFQPQPCLQL